MTTLTKSPISVSQIAESSILSGGCGGGGASARTCGDVVLAVAVAGCCCCWSPASGETEGEDEVEDDDDVPDVDEEEEPDEGEVDDEEDVIEEDNVVAVEGKICTISIGAWPCSSCSSGLQLGVRSGVLVTNVAVEAASGGRALSIELNSVASVSCC